MFAAPTDVDRLDLETVLERHPQALCRVVEEGPGVAIEFPGNRVSGPHRIATALHFVAGTQRFAVRELPGELNAEAKVVLARRLLREGLLRVVIPPPPESVGDDTTPSRDVEAETAPPTTGWETLESARQVQSLAENVVQEQLA